MRHIPLSLMFTFMLLPVAGCSSKKVDTSGGVGVPAGEATVVVLSDLADRPHRPLLVAPGELSVLVFMTTDCPIANAYAPEIRRLCDTYDPGKVRVYVVQIDKELTWADARKHAASFGLECPVLIDRDHALVRAAGATVTPEAAVIVPGGRIVYLGRISDLYADLGVLRAAATKHDLREAIDAALAGRPVPRPRTVAVGCAIPR